MVGNGSLQTKPHMATTLTPACGETPSLTSLICKMKLVSGLTSLGSPEG